MKSKNFLLILIAICILSSIKADCVGSSLGAILQGILGSPSGTLNAAGGSVDLDYPGDKSNAPTPVQSTTTDANGFYRFENISPGTYNINFSKGSYFETIYDVVIEEDQLVTVNGTLYPENRLGVFLGARDNIQEILVDVGYGDLIDTLTLNDFNNVSTLMNYSVIFINGGSSSSGFNLVQQNNLSSYLTSGGNIYASDSAVFAFCDLLQNLGIDSCGSQNYIGDPQTITCDIPNSSLDFYLGNNQATISYIQPRWFSINDTVENFVNIYTRGTYTTRMGNETVNDRVLSFNVDFTPNIPGGKLIYTTFRNEPNQTQADVIKILMFYIFEF